MNDAAYTKSASQGKITRGIRQNTHVERTVAFVYDQLPCWRDHPDKPSSVAENSLSSHLCDYLDVQAREKLKMVHFKNEAEQERKRRVDIAAKPIEGMFIGSTYYSISDPILVFEAKRLPTSPPKEREREYVRGEEKKTTGGIQRFKRGLHGGKHEIAVMIGYVQGNSVEFWHDRINSWIRDLAAKSPCDGELWENKEQLEGLRENSSSKTARSSSEHSRTGSCKSTSIKLHHFWIIMNTQDTTNEL